MKLREFLNQFKTMGGVGEIVVIREHGYLGLTRIDNKGVFMHSLNPVILDLYNVVNYAYETRDWAKVPVMAVDIKLDQGGDKSC